MPPRRIPHMRAAGVAACDGLNAGFTADRQLCRVVYRICFGSTAMADRLIFGGWNSQLRL